MEFLKKLNLEDSEVLDVATGAGEFLYFLKEFIPNTKKLVAIDNNAQILDYAKKMADKRKLEAEFTEASADDLPFDDNSFDLVTVSNSIHHFPEPHKILNEMWRVLRKDGVLLVMEMTQDKQKKASQSHTMLHHLSAEMDTLMGRYHRHTYKSNELQDIINETLQVETQTHFEDWEIPENMDEKILEVLNTKIAPTFEKLGDKKPEFELKRQKIEDYIKENGYNPCSSMFLWAKK